MTVESGMMVDQAKREALCRAIVDSPTYRLAHEDLELLADDDLRPVRMQLELAKPGRA